MNPELIESVRENVASLEAELRELQRALDGARAYLAYLSKGKNGNAPATIPPATLDLARAVVSKMKVTATVLDAVGSCPNDYTIYDVEKVLSARGQSIPRRTLSQVFSRLVNAKKVAVKETGKGPKPSIFTKEEPTF